MSEVGDLMRRAREDKGLSEGQLAERVGVARARIERLESAPPEQTPAYVYERVCRQIGVDLPRLCAAWVAAEPVRFAEGVERLRSSLGLADAQLAEAAGLSLPELKRFQSGEGDVARVLLRLSNALDIGLGDLSFVLLLRRATRRFQAFNVGIGKSGTMSMANVFSGYGSVHEFLFERSMKVVMARRAGQLDDPQLRDFLLARDRLGMLELDSGGFHVNWVEELGDLFPEARFILTLRDCYSWLDSFLNTIVNDAPHREDWHFDAIYARGFGLTREMIQSPERLLEEIPPRLDALVDAWAVPNRRVLEVVPEHRRLVIRTHEISSSLDRLAAFVGVPEDSLDAEGSRSHVRADALRHGLIGRLAPGLVEKSVEARAADLMEAFFSDFTPPEGGS